MVIPVEHDKINQMNPYISVRVSAEVKYLKLLKKSTKRRQPHSSMGCLGELRFHICAMDTASTPSVPTMLKQ